MNELYSRGVHHGTAQFEVGDVNLNLESSWNRDLTFRYQSDRGHGEVGVFHTSYDHFISLLPSNELVLTIRGAFPKFTYVQADARIWGLDGFLEYDLFPFMEAYLSSSLVFGRNTTVDRPLYQMPSSQMTAGLRFHLPTLPFLLDSGFGFEGRFVKRQTSFPEGIDYVDPPPGYNLFNANLHGEFVIGGQHLHLQIGVRNLFNTRYRDYLSRFRYFIDNPGRNLNLNLSIPFGHFLEEEE